MQIRWIALGFAAVTGYGYLVTADYERGDAKLRTFYSQMLAADFSGAQHSIDEAIRLWPDNARYHVWRGYCLSQSLPPQCSKQPIQAPEAEAEFRAALKLNDRDAVAHHDLAWLAHLAGNDGEARKEWLRSVEIDPDNAVFHMSLGMFLEEAGDAQEAADHLATAVQLSPAVLDSPFFTRHGELAQTIVRRCISETEGRLVRGDDPVLKARLGKFHLFTHDFGRAAPMLQDAARDLPNLPLVWFNLGEVYRLRGDTTQALACYERARYLDSRLAGPHLRISSLDQSGHAVEELRPCYAAVGADESGYRGAQ